MPKSPENVTKILDWVKQSKQAYPEDTDTVFISRLINTYYTDRKSINLIYEALEMKGKTQKEILEALSKKEHKNITAFTPQFLHFSWGLFEITQRSPTAQEKTAHFEKANSLCRTMTMVLMLSRAGKLIGTKKVEDEHDLYFKKINNLFNSQALEISKLSDMKASEFSAALQIIEGWIKLDIFTKSSPSLTLDIVRHETREKIRQLTFDTLATRCKDPLKDLFRWDIFERDIIKADNKDISDKIAKRINVDIHNDTNLLYNEIRASIYPQTEYEKSLLKQALASGFINTIEIIKNIKSVYFIDIHICASLINQTFNFYKMLLETNDLRTDDLKKIINLRKEFTSSEEHHFKGHVSIFEAYIHTFELYKVFYIILSIAAIIIIFLNSGISFSEYVNNEILKVIAFTDSAAIICLAIDHLRHIHKIGNQPIICNDERWADTKMSNANKIDESYDKKLRKEKKGHEETIKQTLEEEVLRKEKPAKEAEIKKKTEEAVELKIKIEEDAIKKSREDYELKRLEEYLKGKEEALRIKELRRQAHVERIKEKESNRSGSPEPNIQIEFMQEAPVAEPPPPIRMPAPPLPPRPPKQQLKQGPPQETNPIVMFALGDKNRDAFIGYVRQMMNLFQTYLRNPQIEASPEGLAALKYDLLQICESIIAIRSKQKSGQERFINTLVDQHQINTIYRLRNGLVHQDDALTYPEKQGLYQAVINQLSVIGELHQPNADIQPNAICREAIARPREFPIRFNLDPAAQALYTRLIEGDRNININQAFIEGIQQKHRYLSHIIEQYFEANNPEDIKFKSKVLLMTIAELGEIYKEIYVHSHQQQAFENTARVMNPNIIINRDLVERFIRARRDIVHSQDLNGVDLGVIISSKGSTMVDTQTNSKQRSLDV